MRLVLGSIATLLSMGSVAGAATLQVPGDHADLASAIAAAAPGDRIEVASGRHCGAVINKRLTLVGRDGATIVACVKSPVVAQGLRAGFLLAGRAGTSAASDTSITGFAFEGAGKPRLAFGVFGRFASGVIVSGNTFHGTIQAITNTAGDRWVITNNVVRGLTALSYGGGAGIVVQSADGEIAAWGGTLNPANRPEDNTIADNDVTGRIPTGLDDFSMAAILVVAADRTVVSRNKVRLPANRAGRATGQGVLVTSRTFAVEAATGARETVVEENDGRDSEVAVVVEAAKVTNKAGLELRDNRGKVVVEEHPAAE
jgi:hypothetical protein